MRIHLRVGEQPQLLELVGGQQMGLVHDEDDSLASLGLLGGQGICGLPVETHIRRLRKGLRSGLFGVL